MMQNIGDNGPVFNFIRNRLKGDIGIFYRSAKNCPEKVTMDEYSLHKKTVYTSIKFKYIKGRGTTVLVLSFAHFMSVAELHYKLSSTSKVYQYPPGRLEKNLI